MARRRASQRSLSTQPVAAFGLGTWQVQRLRWKEALIEDLSAKLKLPAMRLPPLVKCVVIPVARLTSSVDAIPEFAYRRVLVRGVLDHSREMLLGPHLRHGRLCYSLITPLHRTDTDGSEAHADILVNRGVIDRDLADRAKRPGSLESQPVAIVGMLRSQQRKSMMASDNRPDLGQWIHVDIERMAEHAGTQPVLIDEIYGAVCVMRG